MESQTKAKPARSVYSRAELESRKDYAQTLYTRDKLTQEEISKKTGVHHNTINKWATAGNWKSLRRNLAVLRQQQVAFMMEEMDELNNSIRVKPKGERYADPKQGQARYYLMRHINELETSPAIKEMINAGAGLLDFLEERDLSEAAMVGQLINDYIESLVEKLPFLQRTKLNEKRNK